MLEPKAKKEMEDSAVLAKQDAAMKWCERATAHAATCGGKSWKYALIAHDRIATNMTIAGLAGK
jgi:type III restriction enzyme